MAIQILLQISLEESKLSKIADNVSLLDKYDVAEGEKLEDIAYKIYGDTDYFWVVTLVNNIVNRYYDW